MSTIAGNMIGSYSQLGKTFILTDESGHEYTGVVTDQEVIFTATDNDVRENMVYASDAGVSTGTKVIPYYNTSEGYKLVGAGSAFTLELSLSGLYDYTKLQCIICPYNSSISQSVSAEKVVIENNVYPTNSTTSVSVVSKDPLNEVIHLGITNDTSKLYIIRYFTYKEIE